MAHGHGKWRRKAKMLTAAVQYSTVTSNTVRTVIVVTMVTVIHMYVSIAGEQG